MFNSDSSQCPRIVVPSMINLLFFFVLNIVNPRFPRSLRFASTSWYSHSMRYRPDAACPSSPGGTRRAQGRILPAGNPTANADGRKRQIFKPTFQKYCVRPISYMLPAMRETTRSPISLSFFSLGISLLHPFFLARRPRRPLALLKLTDTVTES
ncbi:hypothetical protein BGY98DRAFT_55222 [Russula aff. rugulosa BPL654]|nr:hypothetical protein BGY98DRAFT_55222 [Russula aff. rugulosa BPL654]